MLRGYFDFHKKNEVTYDNKNKNIGEGVRARKIKIFYHFISKGYQLPWVLLFTLTNPVAIFFFGGGGAG